MDTTVGRARREVFAVHLPVIEREEFARLLRPLNPLVAYAAENVGAMPLRIFLVVPLAIAAVAIAGPSHVTHDPLLLTLFPVAVVGAWLITFLAMAVIGALAFYVESSSALFEVWLGLFGVFSGYLIPLELFPRWLAVAARFLPFRYMLAFPVEMIVGMTARGAALAELGIQWLFVAALWLAARETWRHGLRRFAAYGG